MFIIRLLFIVSFIYLLSFVVRKMFVRPFRQGYQERETRNKQDAYRKSEGKVSVDTKGAGRAHDNKSVGEYIDYEEVNDEEDRS